MDGIVMGGMTVRAVDPATLIGAGFDLTRQATLRTAIDCNGTGLHSGRRIALRLVPAAANTGIVFRRTDLDHDIPALWDNVVDTKLCTVLGDPVRPDARVGTIEHLMAAFAALGIDNAVVELDGPEVPILDGSAEPFLFLLECAGRQEQPTDRPVLTIRRPVRVEHGDGFAELRPLPPGEVAQLDLSLTIDFSASAIGRQALSLALSPESFRRELADARTFTLASDVEHMRAAGLALGGSLRNAVVVDQAKILNPEGLRRPDEFVRHKMLDVVGDLALSGYALRARFVAHRPGHTLNNRLLRALFAEPANWAVQTRRAVAA